MPPMKSTVDAESPDDQREVNGLNKKSRQMKFMKSVIPVV